MGTILSYLYFEGDDSVLVGKFLDYPELDLLGDVKERTLEEFKSLEWYKNNKTLFTDLQLTTMLQLVPKKKLQVVNIYTDGSAHGKTRLGGIGVYIYVNINGERHESRISKGYSNTKIGRMELMAIITALEEIMPHHRGTTKIILKSDSAYAVNCVAKGWLWRWKNDFGGLAARTNGDLLQRLLNIHEKFPKGHISVSHVKGHNGDSGNEEADRLAGIAYKSGKYIVDMK